MDVLSAASKKATYDTIEGLCNVPDFFSGLLSQKKKSLFMQQWCLPVLFKAELVQNLTRYLAAIWARLKSVKKSFKSSLYFASSLHRENSVGACTESPDNVKSFNIIYML